MIQVFMKIKTKFNNIFNKNDNKWTLYFKFFL